MVKIFDAVDGMGGVDRCVDNGSWCWGDYPKNGSMYRYAFVNNYDGS